MVKIKNQRRIFISKEVRFLILLAIIPVLIFSVFLRPIVPVVLGCGIVIILLSIIFSRYFKGQLQRLERSIDLVREGNYSKRLQLRERDNQHLKSFVENINNMLDDIEERHLKTEELLKEINTELSKAVSIKDSEKQGHAILSLHEKVKSAQEDKDKKAAREKAKEQASGVSA